MNPVLAAMLPAALCTRLSRRRTPRPRPVASLPVLYAGRPEDPPQRVLTMQWQYRPTRQP